MSWSKNQKNVLDSLHEMFHDENGPDLKQQVKFFDETAEICRDYAKEIKLLMGDGT